MSTTVTIAVAAPNHLPVKAHIEHKNGAQWQPAGETLTIDVGGAATVLVHANRRLVIEEAVNPLSFKLPLAGSDGQTYAGVPNTGAPIPSTGYAVPLTHGAAGGNAQGCGSLRDPFR